jgi:hypothetical protein
MSPSPPPFLDLITRQLELWGEQRADLQRQIDEIDAKLAGAAKALGIKPQESAIDVGALPRLPKRDGSPGKDGTMAQFIREFLASADRGHTRAELKAAVRDADSRFAEMITRNENGFYNAVKRLIKGGGAVDIDGVLYDARRAPEGGGEAAAPSTLPPNVTLFGPFQHEGQA